MARKAKLKGIRQRGDRWQVDVTVNGRRRTATAHTLEEAKQLRLQMEQELRSGEQKEIAQAPTSWTLKKALETALSLPAPDGWKGSRGVKAASVNAQAALDFLGADKRMDEVTTTDLDEWFSHLLTSGNTPATVNRKRSALSKLFSVAERRGGVTRRPYFPSRLAEGPGRIRVLSDKEEARVLGFFRREQKLDHVDAMLVFLDTGLRMGELWPVEPRDINFEGRSLHVVGIERRGTKNGQTRDVPLTSRARNILKRRCESLGPRDKVFPLNNASFGNAWDRARAFLTLEDDPLFVPYVLRHTCASRLAKAGVYLARIQKWMGHKTISITIRYVHLFGRDLEDHALPALEQYGVGAVA